MNAWHGTLWFCRPILTTPVGDIPLKTKSQVHGAIVVLVGCLITAGCDARSLPTVPVKGKITYGGGDWPATGTLYFAPVTPAANMPRKPGIAEFAIDGTFSASTFSQDDGLVPGKYRINVECWLAPPAMDRRAPTAQSAVPNKYRAGTTSGFEVDVPADASGPIELSLDVPKP